MNGQAGKGSRRRPMQISQAEYDRRWREAFYGTRKQRKKKAAQVLQESIDATIERRIRGVFDEIEAFGEILDRACERHPELPQIIEANGQKATENWIEDMDKPCPLLDMATAKPRLHVRKCGQGIVVEEP